MNNNLDKVYLEGDLKVEIVNPTNDNKSIQELVDCTVNTKLLDFDCFDRKTKQKVYPDGSVGFHYKLDAEQIVRKSPSIYDLCMFYVKAGFEKASEQAQAIKYFEQRYSCLNPANYKGIKQFVRRSISPETLAKTYFVYVNDNGEVEVETKDILAAEIIEFVVHFLLQAKIITKNSKFVKSSSKTGNKTMLLISFGELFDEYPYAYTACKDYLDECFREMCNDDGPILLLESVFKEYCPYER